MKYLLSVLLLIGCAGCVKVTDADDEASPEAVVANSGLGTAEFEIVALEAANAYSVRLNPPAAANRVYRKNIQTSDVGAAIAKDGSGLYNDSSVVAGTKYEYSFVHEDATGSQVISQIQVQIPTDFVCNAVYELNANTAAAFANYNRIYLGPSAVVRTLGQSVTIKASLIKSEGGVIETFVSGATAAAMNHGRYGGFVQITANTARGKLFINMRGEHGNNSGYAPPGAPAANTNSIIRRVVPVLTPGHQMFLNAEEMTEANRKPASNDGNQATRGGGSGILSFYVEDAADFILDATFEAGAKGIDYPAPAPGGFG